MTTIPPSDTERWDELADQIRRSKGKWVLIADEVRRPRHEKAKEALERRGVVVEVTSRIGHGITSERPWVGWRTWARMLSSVVRDDG